MLGQGHEGNRGAPSPDPPQSGINFLEFPQDAHPLLPWEPEPQEQLSLRQVIALMKSRV